MTISRRTLGAASLAFLVGFALLAIGPGATTTTDRFDVADLMDADGSAVIVHAAPTTSLTSPLAITRTPRTSSGPTAQRSPLATRVPGLRTG